MNTTKSKNEMLSFEVILKKLNSFKDGQKFTAKQLREPNANIVREIYTQVLIHGFHIPSVVFEVVRTSSMGRPTSVNMIPIYNELRKYLPNNSFGFDHLLKPTRYTLIQDLSSLFTILRSVKSLRDRIRQEMEAYSIEKITELKLQKTELQSDIHNCEKYIESYEEALQFPDHHQNLSEQLFQDREENAQVMNSLQQLKEDVRELGGVVRIFKDVKNALNQYDDIQTQFHQEEAKQNECNKYIIESNRDSVTTHSNTVLQYSKIKEISDHVEQHYMKETALKKEVESHPASTKSGGKEIDRLALNINEEKREVFVLKETLLEVEREHQQLKQQIANFGSIKLTYLNMKHK